jgi:hypothetical protein
MRREEEERGWMEGESVGLNTSFSKLFDRCSACMYWIGTHRKGPFQGVDYAN